MQPPRAAANWIARLRLTAHPEGGWYRETYHAAESVPAEALPARFGGARSHSTAITADGVLTVTRLGPP
jgi:predicted cupin superfamily sugar epimerase